VIDLHCHILPGIDDGAADLADSIAMARQADEDGIELVCATPHIRHDHDVRIRELPSRVAELNAELEREGLAVRVASGGEVAQTIVSQLDFDELAALTLGDGGRWLLLEPAPGPLGEPLVATVEELGASGYGCVVAHPERHPGGAFLETLGALAERGALIQLTADALLHGQAAEGMLDLASRGLCHLLGSDAHSSRFGRPLALSAGFERLRSVPRLAPHVDWIANEAPAAIVRGDDVRAPY
jgi:protein-tyrosine phosphatase